MKAIIYKSSIPYFCENWPEEPKWLDYTDDHPVEREYEWDFYVNKRQVWKLAKDAAIESAIPVREEDRRQLNWEIWNNDVPESPVPILVFEEWKPVDLFPYPLPDGIEMETYESDEYIPNPIPHPEGQPNGTWKKFARIVKVTEGSEIKPTNIYNPNEKSDADKLRLIAQYMDMVDKKFNNEGREVQDDLLRIADILESLTPEPDQEELLSQLMTTLNGGKPWIVMEKHAQIAKSKFKISRI